MTFFYDLNKKLDAIREKPEVTHKQLNERDMSRAAKGYEKYGKEGMQALAKAGREGKSLDPIRARYNKYDESVEEGSTGDYSAKAARAGKDIGKPGKAFGKIAADAGKRYGSKAAGERVAGAVLNKLRNKNEGIEDRLKDLDPKNPVNIPAYQRKAQSGDSAQAARGMPTKESSMTPKQKSFAALAEPKDKITFADKIAGAKKEVDEMLGDVAAEAIKGALSPKQKKLDKNNNGKLDANDFAMLRKGAQGKQETDEGWDDMMKDVERRRGARKVGDVTHGAKHDIEEIPGGRRVTRRVDPNTGHSVGADDDDDKNTSGEKRGRGRPKGSKKAMGAKGPSGKSKLMTKEAGHDSSELKAAAALLKKAGYKITKVSGEEELDEKAVSKKQQRFMGMVHATQKGEKAPSKEVAKVAKTMKKSDAEDFAATKHKGLPEKKKPEAKKDDAPKKKQKTEEQGGTGTPTASSGFSFGKGIYDSMNRELETMIAESITRLEESMNVSMNMNSDANGGPSKSLTVTATDDDALKLGQLLKMAGLGDGAGPNVVDGSDQDDPGAIEINGTMDADGAEDLAAELRKAQHDHVEGNEECPTCGSSDCGCEEVDEADVSVSKNQPDWPTNQEQADNNLEYAGGLNKPKASGMATIPVTDVKVDGEDKFSNPARMNEDEELARMMEMAGVKKKTDEEKTEEGNKLTAGLADDDIKIGEKIPGTNITKKKDIDEGILASTANLWKEYKGQYGV